MLKTIFLRQIKAYSHFVFSVLKMERFSFFHYTKLFTVHQQVRLPKPTPKPVQQKQKKMEGEEYVCQNKARTGVTGKQFQDEEKPSKLNRMLHEPEPQQVRIWVLQ